MEDIDRVVFVLKQVVAVKGCIIAEDNLRAGRRKEQPVSKN